jgi:hypothetical protein
MKDAPDYTNLNSGVMFHSQTPESVAFDQEFPVGLEFQFLADEGKGPRQTGNVCTPGTIIVIDGKFVTDHIVQSTAPTFPGDEWVKVELEVHGSDMVILRVNGVQVRRFQAPRLDVQVRRFQAPQLDARYEHAPATPLLKLGAPKMLKWGHIALQAEGHPVWFRNIELKSLESP